MCLKKIVLTKMEQDEYDEIYVYLKDTKYGNGKSDDSKRVLKTKAKNFELGSHDNLTKKILRSALRLCHVK